MLFIIELPLILGNSIINESGFNLYIFIDNKVAL